MTNRAITEQNIEPTGRPNVELLSIEPVTLKATVPLSPKINLGDYNDLRVKETAINVSRNDIQERLDQLLREAASWEPADRPVKFGDMVTLNIMGTVNGKSLLEEPDAVYVVDENNPMPFPDFAKNLVDAEMAKPHNFSLGIPIDHQDTRIAGEKINFLVTIKDLKERVLPELDDNFAKGVGDGYDDLSALKKGIAHDLKEQKQQTQDAQYKELALDELMNITTIELPPLLIEHEVDHMITRRNQVVDSLKMSVQDYLKFIGKTEDQSQAEMREQARDRLNRSYALTTLAEVDGIEVSSQEIDEKINEIISSRKEQAENISLSDFESKDVRNSISDTLLVEKALDKLTNIAKGKALITNSKTRSANKASNDATEGGKAVDTKG